MMMKQGGGGNWRRRLTWKGHGGQRNEQASSEKGMANFRNASKAEGACVREHTWVVLPDPRSWTRMPSPGLGHVAHWNLPHFPARILWQFCKSPQHRNCAWSVGSLCLWKERCRGSTFSASSYRNFSKQLPKVFGATVVELVTVGALWSWGRSWWYWVPTTDVAWRICVGWGWKSF